MLREKISLEQLRRVLEKSAGWRPFTAASDRSAWQSLLSSPLNQLRRDWVLAEAQRRQAEPWPQLPLSLRLDYQRSGNRANFETPYFARRHHLAFWALAECLEAQGRFLDPLLDGLWAVCEESSWCIPAHVRKPEEDPEPPVVDLFAAETAADLAAIFNVLEPELQARSPALCRRLRQQIQRRVLDPVLYDEFWWMDGRNNWSSWCTASILNAALIVETDPERLLALTAKLMTIVDRFLAHQAPDGGCPEGPNYWQAAAGQLLLFLEALYQLSDGQIDVYGEPLIRALGVFPVQAHLDGPYFVNFCDAAAKIPVFLRAATYRYGERIQSPELQAFALFVAGNMGRGGTPEPLLGTGNCATPFSMMLRELFWMPAERPAIALHKPVSSWMPDLQLLVARETEQDQCGLILTARGGHNGVPHNHNDVGHFCIYFDGRPVIVDLGSEGYCRATFDPALRYTLLCTRGNSHNAPLINGIEQHCGREYAAEQVHFQRDGHAQWLELDAARAYPAEAGLKSLQRCCRLDAGPTPMITIEDKLILDKCGCNITLNLFAAQPPELMHPGCLRFAGSARPLFMFFEPDDFELVVEPVALRDQGLVANWGAQLWKLTLSTLAETPQFTYCLRFSSAEDIESTRAS